MEKWRRKAMVADMALTSCPFGACPGSASSVSPQRTFEMWILDRGLWVSGQMNRQGKEGGGEVPPSMPGAQWGPRSVLPSHSWSRTWEKVLGRPIAHPWRRPASRGSG
ncbi:hypothetical protein E2C01_101448 [Portunus trituberculatus]|uniref:Uncharacterized protein n=1 Tax=Portunus trituberculatus TaxID=210409 RepID=A0A5B7K9M4_PORTR|nr:hypothetical protein [Portunus trituberculatus]